MAKEETEAQEKPAPKKTKKLLIIVVAVVILLAVAGAAAVMLLGGGKKHGKEGDESAASEKAHAKSVVVPLEDKFTVNLLSDDGSSHYLQIPKMELEVNDEAVAKAVEEKKSKIRDRINSTLRGKTMKEMLEPGSDLKLKEELRSVINDALEVKPASKGVKEVLLPDSFIVQ